MPTSETSEPLSKELLEELAPLRKLLHGPSSNVVFPVAGSGLSQGLDSWPALLKALIQKASETDRPEMEAALSRDQYLDVAGFLEADPAVGRELIAEAIRSRYQRPEKPRPEVFDLLASLPVKHFATTNYDPWLKDAVGLRLKAMPRVYSPGDSGAFADIAPSSPPLVLMLHGDADRPEGCVLSARSYRRLMHRDAAYREGLKALLAQRHWLLVGHSLRDPDFTSLFDSWVETFGTEGSPGAPRHFFLGAGISRLEKNVLLGRGVQPIEYGAKGDHSRLPAVLRHLASPPQATTGTEPGRPIPAAAPAPLRPRVLVAGSRFGLNKGDWQRCVKAWNREGASDPELAEFRVSQELKQSAGLARAQIAAIVRYDVIVDLSPWGAFRRWSSLGLRDAGSDTLGSDTNVPLFFCARAAAGPPADASPREMGPELRSHLQKLLPDGLALCGLSTDDPDERASLEKILAIWPATAVLVDERLRGLDLGRDVRVDGRLDEIKDPSLADYQRALRVVAGRVELLGDDGARPIQDVFVDLEVTRATPPPEQAISEKERDRKTEREAKSVSNCELSRLELEQEDRLRRDEEERRQPVAMIDARTLPRLGARVYLEGVAGSGKTTLLKWLAAHEVDTGAEARVFVPLASLAPPASGRDPLDVCVHAALEFVHLPSEEGAAHEELSARLRKGGAVMLLDGFDEMREDLRPAVPGLVDTLHESVHVVLASRPMGALTTPQRPPRF